MPFCAERYSGPPNKSLVPLVTWSSANFFDLFFLSKFSLAKVAMVVLRIGSINHSDVLLHSDTKISLFCSPRLNQVKRYVSTFFKACVPVSMLNKKSFLSCFEKGFTAVLMTF